jgi:thiamine-monophosphate kinase
MPGEFDIIRDYFTRAPRRADVALGVGDDGAVVQVPADQELVITTDTLIAGRHFPDWAGAADIGWKSLAVNLSDLAAMGAEPAWFTLAIALPSQDVVWLREFSKGLFEAADRYGVDLIGGDTTRGPLAITIHAQGLLPAGDAIRRDGARPGDLVCVTGVIGDAALALAVGRDAPAALASRLHRPVPRTEVGIALREFASAAIDLSDGLAGDLLHVVERSGVGARIELERLPLSDEFRRHVTGADVLRLALAGGDDYELCFTLPPVHLEEAMRRVHGFAVIGQITEQPGLVWQDAVGHPVTLDLRGYDHFAAAS